MIGAGHSHTRNCIHIPAGRTRDIAEGTRGGRRRRNVDAIDAAGKSRLAKRITLADWHIGDENRIHSDLGAARIETLDTDGERNIRVDE